ncbi:MAG: hypothetical protein GXY83_18005 [Rhodopirellula sp.]|nr:hypothetical protein [Rhodopirellula sp.]
MENTKPAPGSPHTDFNGMPCGKLGDSVVSRLVFDGNPLVGTVHSRDLKYVSRLARTYHTPERIQETLRLAEASGINTVLGAGDEAVREYNAAGGKLQFIARLSPKLTGEALAEAIQRNIDGGAVAHYTCECETDELVRTGGFDKLRNVIETAAKFALSIGVGTWAMPVVAACEEAKLPLDFYVKSLHADGYPTARPTPPEVRNEYIQLTPGYFDNIWCAHPDQVVQAFQSITKPWLATKVLATGAINSRAGLTYALEGGADFAAVAMFDFLIAETAESARRVIPRADSKRSRPWRA